MPPADARRESFARKTFPATAKRCNFRIRTSEFYHIIDDVAGNANNFQLPATDRRVMCCNFVISTSKWNFLCADIHMRAPFNLPTLSTYNFNTYNSLLYPFMMGVKQRPTDVVCELGWMNEHMKLFHLCAYYHFESKLVFEELWTNFRNGFLKESGGSKDINALNKSREKWLKR